MTQQPRFPEISLVLKSTKNAPYFIDDPPLKKEVPTIAQPKKPKKEKPQPLPKPSEPKIQQPTQPPPPKIEKTPIKSEPIPAKSEKPPMKAPIQTVDSFLALTKNSSQYIESHPTLSSSHSSLFTDISCFTKSHPTTTLLTQIRDSLSISYTSPQDSPYRRAPHIKFDEALFQTKEQDVVIFKPPSSPPQDDKDYHQDPIQSPSPIYADAPSDIIHDTLDSDMFSTEQILRTIHSPNSQQSHPQLQKHFIDETWGRLFQEKKRQITTRKQTKNDREADYQAAKTNLNRVKDSLYQLKQRIADEKRKQKLRIHQQEIAVQREKEEGMLRYEYRVLSHHRAAAQRLRENDRAFTYSMNYYLNTALGIVPQDDRSDASGSDHNSFHTPPQTPQTPQSPHTVTPGLLFDYTTASNPQFYRELALKADEVLESLDALLCSK
ncbi:hypothetical protein BLNAU_13758 [Blattamonas nauphoetae]|uniref:Uncharacterized protein n=1 Tax=Blattamonas nauphoetae TaxID=2049346 RepID=A0ABQ9XGY9_9EUKA|nr:hypothetical protein BLNAU_13758 [Blattamonas nauphoetae]